LKVTKWSTSLEILNVSEQKAEQISGEPGSLSAGAAVPPSSDAQIEPVAAFVAESIQQSPNVVSPGLAPKHTAGAEISDIEAPKADAPKADAPKADAPKADAAKADVARAPGKVMIMSSGDLNWDRADDAGPEPETEQSAGMFGKRRLAALAAVVALATVAGALGSALATAGLGHLVGDGAASAGNRTFEATIARIDADILNLKLSVEHTSKTGMSQFNRTSDRLERLERAQAEPAAKLARLSEAVEKLRAAAPTAPAAVAAPVAPVPVTAAPVATKETTGSIASPAPTPADAPKVELARLPTVEGWVLRGVANGVALIEGRRGIYEVYAGDPVPGAGRVDAIRRQDGRWVVVTSKGLIVGR
jgi:hypothetical protein